MNTDNCVNKESNFANTVLLSIYFIVKLYNCLLILTQNYFSYFQERGVYYWNSDYIVWNFPETDFNRSALVMLRQKVFKKHSLISSDINKSMYGLNKVFKSVIQHIEKYNLL